MKTLIVQGHPNLASFSHAIAETYQQGLQTHTNPENIREINLAEEHFDPVLRYGYQRRMAPDTFIERSQADLVWADHIVIVTPVWWTTFPSVLHGWFERVLTPGFAYRMHRSQPQRLLHGKTATLIATSWAPGLYTRLIPNSPTRLLRKHLLGVCGIQLNKTYLLGSMDGQKDTHERRTAFLERIHTTAKQHDSTSRQRAE